MTTNWICMTVTVNKACVEIANSRKPGSFQNDGLKKSFLDLIQHLVDDNAIMDLLRDMNRKGRVDDVRDVRTSAYFGSRTSRIQYLFRDKNVFPLEKDMKDGRRSIQSEGLTTTVEGTKIRASVDMVLNITHVNPSDVDELLHKKPDWFCGELIQSGESSAAVKNKKA